jgi:hypothetical protein
MKPKSSPPDLVGISAAAATLQLCEASVRRLANNGALPCQRTSKGFRVFKKADIEELAAARTGGVAV